MRIHRLIILALAITGALTSSHRASADPLRLAVAANFTQTAQQLADEFMQRTGLSVTISSGSSGQLATQAREGAPFDIFLSADTQRPEELVSSGLAIASSRFTYAIGQLVLWRPTNGTPPDEQMLRSGQFAHLALCNPATAPYGAAAIETLKAWNLYDQLRARLVVAQSVSQALELIQSGNAELGFVALAQVSRLKEGKYTIIPESLYTPLRQDVVLLSRAGENIDARQFMTFLHGPQAREMIKRAGYLIPNGEQEAAR